MGIINLFNCAPKKTLMLCFPPLPPADTMYWSNTQIDPSHVRMINNQPIMESRDDYVNLEYSVMATSYALLLYLSHNRLSEAVPIMKWLISQHKWFNYWSSTQVALVLKFLL